ncbi:MAG: TonB C-terminal domain-containing protein [Thiovulaceae bacterium]|jgi:hypothetical protein|nr:TonB C-terminal domain-containing protein [Sulfurimonadaceae bacterium]
MQKIFFLLFILSNLLNADFIEVKQNIKALYHDVQLTPNQQEYILENEYENVETLKKIFQKELKKQTKLHTNEKNVVEFSLHPNGEISDIKFLKKSNSYQIDKATKNVILQAASQFKKPIEQTPMRFIFDYKPSSNQQTHAKHSSETASEPTYQNISRGTTRFEHSSREYVRVFQTNKDGFVNLSVHPNFCMERATILTEQGQKVHLARLYEMNINKEIPQGKYKLLLKTKQTCNVNLQYP